MRELQSERVNGFPHIHQDNVQVLTTVSQQAG